MAALATLNNVPMSCDKKRCRGKNNSGIVADTAVIFCRDVIDFLGGCDACVMAGRAIVGVYAQVAKSYARKAGKVIDIVTRRTIQGRRYMIDRLSNADPIVMARRAVVNIYAHVIKRRIPKVRSVMARGAIGCGG
jgi:hypothetical protein